MPRLRRVNWRDRFLAECAQYCSRAVLNSAGVKHGNYEGAHLTHRSSFLGDFSDILPESQHLHTSGRPGYWCGTEFCQGVKAGPEEQSAGPGAEQWAAQSRFGASILPML